MIEINVRAKKVEWDPTPLSTVEMVQDAIHNGAYISFWRMEDGIDTLYDHINPTTANPTPERVTTWLKKFTLRKHLLKKVVVFKTVIRKYTSITGQPQAQFAVMSAPSMEKLKTHMALLQPQIIDPLEDCGFSWRIVKNDVIVHTGF